MEFGKTDDNLETATPEVETGKEVTTDLPEAIQKKIENQDAFIEKLKSEAKERDEQLIKVLEKQAGQSESQANKAEFVALIESLKSNSESPEVQEPSPGKEISIDEIVAAVGNNLKEEALETQRKQNLQACMDTAREALGEEFDKVVVQIAKSKSMSIESVNDMARNNPSVFNELFIPAKDRSTTPNTDTSVTDAGLDPSTTPEVKSIGKMNSKERSNYMQQLINAQLNQ